MIQNITKHIPITTLIISYFFLCGGLFLIGFWGTFDTDISNFISLSDIPKNFIVPFAFSQGSVLFSMLINVAGPQMMEDEGHKEENINKSLWRRRIEAIFSLDMLLILVSGIIASSYYTHRQNVRYWVLSTICLAVLFSLKLSRTKFFQEQIRYYTLRLYVASIICQVPLVSFSTGKVNSLSIYNNDKYKTISIVDNTGTLKTDSTIKFIGFIGDKLVVSSIDNRVIHFINQDSYKEVNLTQKK